MMPSLHCWCVHGGNWDEIEVVGHNMWELHADDKDIETHTHTTKLVMLLLLGLIMIAC